jgi:hypothetical protein
MNEITIGEKCFPSNPCQHIITVNGKMQLMNAKDIIDQYESILSNKDKEHFSYIIKEKNRPKKIDIGTFCYETYPCQHMVKIDDKPSVMMLAKTIVTNYWNILSDADKEHLKYVKNM